MTRVKDELPPSPDPLPRPVIDSHCHLDTAEQVTGLDPADALERAAAVNITRIVQVGTDVEGSRWAVEAARRFDTVVATVSIHPNDAARLGRTGLPDALAEIDRLAGEDRVRGVGETGLDYFRTTETELQQLQQESFAAHIAMARRHDRTLVIHDRDAHDDILAVLDAEGVPERVVMHCFSGDADFARACLDRGAWLSFPGPVTYKANSALREALRITPADRLLTETDAPYLVPVPWRGYPNASYLIPHTVRFMAAERGDDLDELCDSLTSNAFAAFGGAW
ncbi:AraC family transcriptional regulator [Enemella evansiae]|uniref:AraC family transcriptional regulator n=1 Tax=Enemella evansiae TaxID=2016499 RepID=A0A255GC99_9ACTN|nr:TatD family hydrolase [Enemella evansiae]OYO13518.1 AraC family transcriptional regulator [Enemella evansiae]